MAPKRDQEKKKKDKEQKEKAEKERKLERERKAEKERQAAKEKKAEKEMKKEKEKKMHALAASRKDVAPTVKKPVTEDTQKVVTKKEEVFKTRPDGSYVPFTSSLKERLRGRTPVFGVDEFPDSPPYTEPPVSQLHHDDVQEPIVRESIEKDENSTKAARRQAKSGKSSNDNESDEEKDDGKKGEKKKDKKKEEKRRK